MPKESGIHDINVSYNDIPVHGTPMRLIVDSSGGQYLTAYGEGLTQGASSEELTFFVTGNAKDTDVKIDGPGQADIIKKEQKDGYVVVVYRPLSPGEYDIHIKNKGRAIHGSPFSAKISGEGRKRSQMSVPASSEYTLGGKDVDLTNMVGVIKTPSGATEPCLLKKMPDGKLGIASFQAKSKGTYTVEVKQDGKAIAGSPFKINIDDHHVTSGQKVKVAGHIKDGAANQWNDVTVNIAEAGYGSLGLSVEGGHRSDLEMKSKSATEYTLQYKPHEPGVYLLNIKFAEEHIAGSPFIVSVGGQPSGRVRETATCQVQAPELIVPGQKTHIMLKIPGTDPLDMEATLTSPSGKIDTCEIRDLDDSLCQINFTPSEEGVHTISLKFKGIHFAGSPYQYTVGKVPSGGTHKVEFGGPGVERGEVGAKNEFNVYTREAGAGVVSVSIEGPSQAKIEMVDRHCGYVTVGYVVSKAGEYGVHVKLNDEHVPESPAMLYIAPESGDAKKITLVGLRDRGLEIGKPATFNLEMNGAHGEIKAHVDTPAGTEDDVFVTELDDERYAVRFMPHENGVYFVHIKFNEAHIPGSPIPILVGKLGADPALVLARGDGLEKGESGKASKFTVVTANAGAGILAALVEGPSKVALTCSEVADGYEFSYTPMAPGNYMIMVKYSNITIAGAPFKAVVTGAGKGSEIAVTSSLFVETVEKKPGVVQGKRFHGDASRVVASGNGLKKGFSGRAANFTLDIKDAGQALLTLGMMSPTGHLMNDMSVKKQRPTAYQVSYTPPEKGDHTLVVRWGTDDIPGSPFTIHVS